MFELTDAEQMAAEYPDTFHIPDHTSRHCLRVGDLAKLDFIADEADRDDFGTERMWVKVTEVRPGPRYIGALSNQPVVCTDIEFGSPITFEPRHVCAMECSE
jgi:hypothetical protein